MRQNEESVAILNFTPRFQSCQVIPSPALQSKKNKERDSVLCNHFQHGILCIPGFFIHTEVSYR